MKECYHDEQVHRTLKYFYQFNKMTKINYEEEIISKYESFIKRMMEKHLT